MTLPVLFSIPHGGWRIPEEVGDRVVLTPAEVLEDNDAFAIDLYDLGKEVRTVLSTEVARAVVDLNRAPDDLPPRNPDGAVKTQTCTGRPVYDRPLEEETARVLLDRYHRPFHERLREACATADVVLGLDCHTMAAVGPKISPDPGRTRPTLCLGDGRGKACPRDVVDLLAASLARAFDLPAAEVTVNRPFSGGHITRTYGGSPIPWIQVEMSRALYLADPWFDREARRLDPGRAREIRGRFREGLESFFEDWGAGRPGSGA